MISYRDMAFCSRADCANFSTCERALTDEVRQDAIRWWGSEDAPIGIGWFTECFAPDPEIDIMDGSN